MRARQQHLRAQIAEQRPCSSGPRTPQPDPTTTYGLYQGHTLLAIRFRRLRRPHDHRSR
jgi:hypothetical protein